MKPGDVIAGATIVSSCGRNEHRNVVWLMQCPCGAKFKRTENSMTSTRSRGHSVVCEDCGIENRRTGQRLAQPRMPRTRRHLTLVPDDASSNAMGPGYGDRHENCMHYDECLTAFVRSAPVHADNAQCDPHCSRRADVPHEVRLLEATRRTRGLQW